MDGEEELEMGEQEKLKNSLFQLQFNVHVVENLENNTNNNFDI